MFILRSLVVFNLCFQAYDSSNHHYRRTLWTLMKPPDKFRGTGNATIYLGYSNNPFGASTKTVSPNKEAIINKISTTRPSRPLKENDESTRSKRGVIQLYNMVSCGTGCNPLIYIGYGCFCGYLGSGYAMDGIDRCCQAHDWCYDTSNCPMYFEYIVPYFWKCYHNMPLCGVLTYKPYIGSCAQRLCECDRLLSQCLSKYPCPTERALCRSSPWRFLQNALLGF